MYMSCNAYFNRTIEWYQNFEEVDAIALGGSKAADWYDDTSDYDVYVYLNNDLSAEKKKSILNQTCKHIGLGKTHWGVYWDDCILKSGVPIEINYMTLTNTRQSLQNTLIKYIPWGGYTTCTCRMVFNSIVLHDPKGLYNEMVTQFTMPYPEQLRKNIISTNRELLQGITPSYFNQIEKAIKRNDTISINHRIASFIESYFDILFALNRVFHPGEKQLMRLSTQLCQWLPIDFEINLKNLLNSNRNNKTLPILHKLLSNIDDLIAQHL